MIVTQTAVHLRPAAADDAELLRRWRAEPSVGRYMPMPDIPLEKLRVDLAAQHILDLYRGRGEKFQRLVDKLGYTREGLLRGYFKQDGKRIDTYIYSLLRDEYLAPTARCVRSSPSG